MILRTPVTHQPAPQLQLFATGYIRAGQIDLRAEEAAAAELDALIDEVYGKPNLGIDDSAGIFDLYDYDGEADDLEADMLDREDWAAGRW